MRGLLTILVVAFFATAKEYEGARFTWQYYNDVWEMSTTERGSIAYDDDKDAYIINFYGGVPEFAFEEDDFTDLRTIFVKFDEWSGVARKNGVKDADKIISIFGTNLWWKPAFENTWYVARNTVLTAKFSVENGDPYLVIYGSAETDYGSPEIFLYMGEIQAHVFLESIKAGSEAKYKANALNKKKTENLFN